VVFEFVRAAFHGVAPSTTTLVGFLRGQSMNVYAGAQRIIA
jgi:formate dehydrogenase assembly factor FdhD